MTEDASKEMREKREHQAFYRDKWRATIASHKYFKEHVNSEYTCQEFFLDSLKMDQFIYWYNKWGSKKWRDEVSRNLIPTF